MIRTLLLFVALLPAAASAAEVRYYPVPSGSRPHDVAPAPDGSVWYTSQPKGALGRLDPKTGKVDEIRLGRGSSPHGVIFGPDGAAWVTDGGLNAIVRVDPKTRAVKNYPLPPGTDYANLNTAAFDGKGMLWFTGQGGYYGRVDPRTGDVKVWEAPRGRGAYGITATPAGEVYYASLAGSHIARIDTGSGEATVIEPPTRNQGARRVWSDSRGRIWVSEWNSGQVSVYDPSNRSWKQWKLPGERPHVYSVYVDERDQVWLTEWSTNAIVKFDPRSEKFESFPSNRRNAQVRQMLGRPGEAWGAESGTDRLVVIRAPS
ncbi:MAG: lyase [Betaproteobacteria bacterium RBG_16_64_9]|nr:MAG: lyase [Betaproteobacteria bacterium RBG_16_64_9]